MKAAFAEWDQRIAPVFDVARRVSVVEADSGRVLERRREELTGALPAQRVLRLAELGIETLVCGAISRPLYLLVAAHDIQVIPFVSGDLEEVIQAWLEHRLAETAYSMPGCRGRFRHGVTSDGTASITEGFTMRGMNRPGMEPGKGPGAGQGRGQGRGRGRGQGGGQGRGQGRGTAQSGNQPGVGPGGNCVCPGCGHTEPHEPGVPCLQKVCPQCGTALTRQ